MCAKCEGVFGAGTWQKVKEPLRQVCATERGFGSVELDPEIQLLTKVRSVICRHFGSNYIICNKIGYKYSMGFNRYCYAS